MPETALMLADSLMKWSAKQILAAAAGRFRTARRGIWFFAHPVKEPRHERRRQ